MERIGRDEIVRIAYTTVRRMSMGGVCSADRDDIAQEAAMRALSAEGSCGDDYTPEQQRAYYSICARGQALRVLRNRSKQRSREALTPGNEDWQAQTPEGFSWVPLDHCAEDYVLAAQMQEELRWTVEAARMSMSAAQLAVFDERIGIKELPEEMLGLTTATRAVHARAAREKVAAAARQEGVTWLDATLVAALCTR